LENYVKHDIKSFGVGIPDIRKMIQTFEKHNHLRQQELARQTEFLNDLMKQDYTEPQLAAILFMQLYWKTGKPAETLILTSKWFDSKCITDWNVCDWLCVRVLSPILDEQPALSISHFKRWNRSQNLWKARASLVPFTQCKSLSGHKDSILEFSEVLIQRGERFCKTAVGWVLREYSKIDSQVVTDFLEKHKKWTNGEVIKNATKYL
jgi:3-methyladenine DNA glycosylase AlkD